MIGNMRERVTLQTEQRTPDGIGGHTKSWTNQASMAAQVLPLPPKEREIAMQMGGQQPYRVTVRFRKGIKPKDRLLWGDLVLEITGVFDKDGRRRFLTIDCDTRITK